MIKDDPPPLYTKLNKSASANAVTYGDGELKENSEAGHGYSSNSLLAFARALRQFNFYIRKSRKGNPSYGNVIVEAAYIYVHGVAFVRTNFIICDIHYP